MLIRTPRPLLALLGVALLATVALACGNDAPPPEGVTDEGYLSLLCTNLDRFSDAVLQATEEAALAAVLQDFIDALRAVEPSADLRDFHAAFIAYLEDALDDPTSPLALAPPLPEEEARERLARTARSVDACREPTFFSTPQNAVE